QQAAVNSQRALHQANVASLELARKQFGRIEQLFKRGAATRQDFDQAQNQMRQAEATAQATSAQTRAQSVELRYYGVIAPVAGTVGDIPVRVGDLVTPLTVLTTLDDNKALEVYVEVPLERAAALKIGAPVEILNADDKVEAQSTVTFVSPRADPATQMILVKASVDNHAGKLRAGQFVRVRLIWRQYEGVAVPVLAILRRADGHPAPGGAGRDPGAELPGHARAGPRRSGHHLRRPEAAAGCAGAADGGIAVDVRGLLHPPADLRVGLRDPDRAGGRHQHPHPAGRP